MVHNLRAFWLALFLGACVTTQQSWTSVQLSDAELADIVQEIASLAEELSMKNVLSPVFNHYHQLLQQHSVLTEKERREILTMVADYVEQTRVAKPQQKPKPNPFMEQMYHLQTSVEAVQNSLDSMQKKIEQLEQGNKSRLAQELERLQQDQTRHKQLLEEIEKQLQCCEEQLNPKN